jgi:hypothetical protein
MTGRPSQTPQRLPDEHSPVASARDAAAQVSLLRADVAVLGTPAGATALETAFTAAFGTLAPATRARHLLALRSALAGWMTADPTARAAWPKVAVDTTRALTRAQVDAIVGFTLEVRPCSPVVLISGVSYITSSVCWFQFGCLLPPREPGRTRAPLVTVGGCPEGSGEWAVRHIPGRLPGREGQVGARC